MNQLSRNNTINANSIENHYHRIYCYINLPKPAIVFIVWYISFRILYNLINQKKLQFHQNIH